MAPLFVFVFSSVNLKFNRNQTASQLNQPGTNLDVIFHLTTTKERVCVSPVFLFFQVVLCDSAGS